MVVPKIPVEPGIFEEPSTLRKVTMTEPRPNLNPVIAEAILRGSTFGV